VSVNVAVLLLLGGDQSREGDERHPPSWAVMDVGGGLLHLSQQREEDVYELMKTELS
jgi:ribosomal silencing factor RsfS